MIMMPMTSPAASALSDATSRPIDSARASRISGADGQRREEAVDHGRDAGEDLQQRLGPARNVGVAYSRQVDRREQADRPGDQHGDER